MKANYTRTKSGGKKSWNTTSFGKGANRLPKGAGGDIPKAKLPIKPSKES